MRRATIGLLSGFLLLFGSGCAMLELVETRDFLGYKASLKDVQQKYTRFVRWNEFAQASQALEPEQQHEYLAAVRALGGIRITDYEAEAPEYDPLVETATVRVTYSAYHNETMQVITLVEEQRWKRDPQTNDWHLDHEGAPFVEAKSVGAR
jgi:hypothetical protein